MNAIIRWDAKSSRELSKQWNIFSHTMHEAIISEGIVQVSFKLYLEALFLFQVRHPGLISLIQT